MRSLIPALLIALSTLFSAKAHDMSTPTERALSRMVMYRGTMGNLGWATPITGRTLLTASHLVDGGAGEWHRPPFSGSLLSVVYNNVKRDIAVVTISEEDGARLPGMVPLADKLPKPGERVWWKCLGFWKEPHNMDTATPLVASGTFMGATDEVIFIDGFVQGGCSGSGLINENGELFGVLSGAIRWTPSDVVTSATIGRPFYKERRY